VPFGRKQQLNHVVEVDAMIRALVVVVMLAAVPALASGQCTPFDSVPTNVVNGLLPDGGPGPDSTVCCREGVDCDNKCPSCTQVGEPVDTLGGFAWLDRTDLDAFQPWGPSFSFSRHYATAAAERGVGSGALGPGWSHTYSSFLVLFGANPALKVRLFDAEHSGEEYNLFAGQYASLHGGRTLKWDAPTQMYMAERGDGSVWVFSATGRLKVVRSNDGGEAQLRYAADDASCAVSATLPAGALCRVDFLFGRQLWFAYGSTGKLSSVTLDAAHASTVVQLAYSADGTLQSATGADGNAETYTYGFPHVSWASGIPVTLLLQATDADGKLVESFSYAFNNTALDGPARVVSHHTPSRDYTFSWEYLEFSSHSIVRKTHVRSNKENIDLTFANNMVTSACYLDANLTCNTSRLHTYVATPGLLDVQCEQEGAGKFLRHERDAQGRIIAEYSGLASCGVVTAAAQARATTKIYLGATSRVAATSFQSLDPAPPPGFKPFAVSDYTVPASAANAFCGTSSCQTPSAYNLAPLATRLQRTVSIGRTFADTNGAWTTQVRVTAYTFDSSGRPTVVDGPRRDVADTTTYSWNANTWKLDSVLPAGHGSTTFGSYDARGQAHSVGNENGQVHQLNFDALGRATSWKLPGQATATNWGYLPSGRLSTLTAPTGAVDTVTYDADGQVDTETRLASAGSTQPDMVRNYGRVSKRLVSLSLSETDPSISFLVPQRQEGYDYDSQGRRTVTLSSGPSGGSAMGIDDDERLAWRSDQGRFNPADAQPVQSQQYTYDDFGRVIQLKQLIAGSWVVAGTYTWDTRDNLASFKDSKGVTIAYQHDDFGQLISVQSPDFGLRRYVYDEAGNLVKERRGDGTVVQYTYDVANHLSTVTTVGSPAVETWAWNATTTTLKNCAGGAVLPAPLGGGRLTHVTDAAGDWYFGYWPDGRLRYEALVNSSATCAKTLSWEYDSAGLLTATVYPSGARVEYEYPAAGALLHDRPTSLTLVVGTTRTPLLNSIAWVQGEVVAYQTPTQSWSLARGLDGTPSAVSAAARRQDFNTFDGWGNPLSIQETINAGAQAQTLATNDMPALTAATGPGYTPQAYKYLASGDRKSANGAAYCYEAGTHRLALVDGQARYTYTANGALQRTLAPDGSGTTWCYGPRGDAVTVVGPGGEVNRLVTNFRRQRTVEVWPLNGLREDFRVDESSRLLVEAGVASLTALYPRPTREYVWLGGHPVAVIESTEASAGGAVAQKGVTYLFSGQLGEVLVETNAAGANMRQYAYSPFGQRTEVPPPVQVEVPTPVLVSNLGPARGGVASGVSGAREVRLHFTDASWAGCTVDLRAATGEWLGQYAGLHVGDFTGWLPTSNVLLVVSVCAGGAAPWQPVIGILSDVGVFTATPRTEVTTNPYPAAGQQFRVTLSGPSFLQVTGAAVATCDAIEVRSTTGTSLWRWVPSFNPLSPLPIPDITAFTPKLTGTVDIGIWGAGCNATQGRAGFRLAQVLTESTLQLTPPVSIALPGQKLRYDGTVDNWHRYYSPSTGRYLEPDPILQFERFIRAKIKVAAPLSPYSYAKEQPLLKVDPLGLYDMRRMLPCRNWDQAIEKARKRAGCPKNPSCECQKKLKDCNVCDICAVMEDAKGPIALRGATAGMGHWKTYAGLTCPPWVPWAECRLKMPLGGKDELGSGMLRSWATVFNEELCSDTNLVNELASTIIHEASHGCNMFKSGSGPGPDPGGDDGSDCNAYAIERACR
jgi:RHS repeat-associated protein